MHTSIVSERGIPVVSGKPSARKPAMNPQTPRTNSVTAPPNVPDDVAIMGAKELPIRPNMLAAPRVEALTDCVQTIPFFRSSK